MSEFSQEAIRLLGILDEEGKKNVHFVLPVTSSRPDIVRRNLRMLAKDRAWFPRLNTAVDGGVLFIHLKEASRVQVLEELLERALGQIESEHLYDEIYEVLYGGQNGNGQK